MNKVVSLIIDSNTESIVDSIKSKIIKDINVYYKDKEFYKEAERLGVDNFIEDRGFTLNQYLTNLLYFYEFNTKDIPEYIVLLESINGSRVGDVIDDAISRIKYDSGSTSLLSISISKENPYKTFKINKNGNLSSVYESDIIDSFTLNEERFPKTYQLNNYIQIFKYSSLKRNILYGDRIIGFVV